MDYRDHGRDRDRDRDRLCELFRYDILVIIYLYSGVVLASGLQLEVWKSGSLRGLSSSSSWKRSWWLRSYVQVMGVSNFWIIFPFRVELITHTG